MRIALFTCYLILINLSIVSAQGLGSGSTIKDDGRLSASTKQLNQFFRRFNAEESLDGNTRFYPGDSLFHNPSLREAFITRLFDLETSGIPQQLRVEFINQALSKDYPRFLRFHGGDWFSEVRATFMFQGRREVATLIMKVQPQGLGYEWIIDQIIFTPFQDLFDKQSGEEKDFLHPLSHELGFMNLRRAFQESELPESFTASSFSPDYLSIFLYEMKKGNIRFETVNEVKFHFFQINGWYFEVSQFNRPGFNTGWLISSLIKLNPGDKDALQKYIYGKN